MIAGRDSEGLAFVCLVRNYEERGQQVLRFMQVVSAYRIADAQCHPVTHRGKPGCNTVCFCVHVVLALRGLYKLAQSGLGKRRLDGEDGGRRSDSSMNASSEF